VKGSARDLDQLPLFPPLPSVQQVAVWLRETNRAWADPEGGGEYVSLVLGRDELDRPRWEVTCSWHDEPHAGREYVPGDTRPRAFDATGAARRLLAAGRDLLSGEPCGCGNGRTGCCGGDS